MFPLTSLNRAKSSLGTANTDKDGALLGFIPTASNLIAKELKRLDALEKKSRVELFSPTTGQRVFRTQAYPILSVTSIYVDSTGLFDGGETLIPATSYILSPDRRTIIFSASAVLAANAPFPSPDGIYPASLKVTYIGGLAPHAVRSTWSTSTDVGGTMAAGNFIRGGTSQALGIILDRQALEITYEVLYGAFEAETIKEYGRNNPALQGGGPSAETSVSAALVAPVSEDGIEQLSLAESCTDLVTATEEQIRFMLATRDTFALKETGNEGSVRLTGPESQGLGAIPKNVSDLLKPYRNKVLV